MNTDDLRDALNNEAGGQPAVSPDLRSGVDRHVRRQRLRAVVVVASALVLVLVAAVLLAPRAGNDQTVSTADGSTTGSVPSSSSIPPAVVEDPNVPATSTPGAPTPTEPTSVDCGTVTIGLLPTEAIETAPFSCFLKSFNGGGTAFLTIVTKSSEGGSLTERLTSLPGNKITVEGSGTMSVKLPSFNLGSGGGMENPFPGASAPASGDCGTISVPVPDLSTGAPGAHGGPETGGLDREALSCLFGAFLGGGESHVAVEVADTSGGTMMMDLSIGADHQLTLTLDGSLTLQLPAGLQVPEDVLNAIPPGTLGMGQMVPGMGPRTKR